MSLYYRIALLGMLVAGAAKADILTLGGSFSGNVSLSQSVTFYVPFFETGSFSFGSNADLIYPAVYAYASPPPGTPQIYYQIFSSVTSVAIPGGSGIFGPTAPNVGAGEQDFGTGYGYGYSGTINNTGAVFYPGYYYTLSLSLTQSAINTTTAFATASSVVTNNVILIPGIPEPSTAFMLILSSPFLFWLVCRRPNNGQPQVTY